MSDSKKGPQESVDDNEEPVFEVEEILYHREIAKTRQYFVSWVGYPESENSWINEDDMACSALLEDYIKNLKEKQFTSKNLNKIPQITKFEDIKNQGKTIKEIVDSFRNFDGIFYKIRLDDGTLITLNHNELIKNATNLLIDFLESKIITS